MPKEQSKTKSFVLRIDAATMEALEKWAADEFRSINGQLQWLIDDDLLFAHDTIFSIFAANLMQIWGRRKS